MSLPFFSFFSGLVDYHSSPIFKPLVIVAKRTSGWQSHASLDEYLVEVCDFSVWVVVRTERLVNAFEETSAELGYVLIQFHTLRLDRSQRGLEHTDYLAISNSPNQPCDGITSSLRRLVLNRRTRLNLQELL